MSEISVSASSGLTEDQLDRLAGLERLDALDRRDRRDACAAAEAAAVRLGRLDRLDSFDAEAQGRALLKRLVDEVESTMSERELSTWSAAAEGLLAGDPKSRTCRFGPPACRTWAWPLAAP